MREINSKSFEAVVTHKQTFEYMDIGNGIAIYRIISSAKAVKPPKVFGSYTGNERTSSPQFCSVEEAQKMAAGKLKSVNDPFVKHSYAYFSSEELMQAINKYYVGSDELASICKTCADIDMWETAKSDNVDIILFNGWDNSWVDIAGRYIPQAFVYSYMNGKMDNGAYDLGKVLELLRDDPRITFRNFERRSYDRQVSNDVIQQIPYYNASEGRSAQLSFIFSPTVEDMLKVNEWMVQNKGTKEVSWNRMKYQAVDALDLLGIKQFRTNDEALYY